MNRIRVLATVVCIICISGCAAVYSTQPVGTKPHVITPADWEGIWLHRDGAITILVVDAAQGLLQAGWVEKKQDGLSCEQYRIHLREYGTWIFGSVEDPDRPNQYVWGRGTREGEQALAWTTIPEKIAGLVRKGKLPGKVEKGGDAMLGEFKVKKSEEVILGALTDKHLKQLTGGSREPLFDWEAPLTFIRIVK